MLSMRQTSPDDFVADHVAAPATTPEPWREQLLAVIARELSQLEADDANAALAHRDAFKAKLATALRQHAASTAQVDASFALVDREFARHLNEDETADGTKPFSPLVTKAGMGLAGLLLGAVAVVAAVGFSPANQARAGGVAQLLGYSAPALLDAQAAYLKRVTDGLKSYAAANGSYPVTKAQFTDFTTVASFMARKGTDVQPTDTALLDRLKYRSNGLSYKLVYIGTGLCGDARHAGNITVDPARDFAGRDCFAYGTWSSKAARW